MNGPVSWLPAGFRSEEIYYRFLGGPQDTSRLYGPPMGRPAAESISRAASSPTASPSTRSSRITWALEGSYESFRTRYAIESDAGGIADANGANQAR